MPPADVQGRSLPPPMAFEFSDAAIAMQRQQMDLDGALRLLAHHRSVQENLARELETEKKDKAQLMFQARKLCRLIEHVDKKNRALLEENLQLKERAQCGNMDSRELWLARVGENGGIPDEVFRANMSSPVSPRGAVRSEESKTPTAEAAVISFPGSADQFREKMAENSVSHSGSQHSGPVLSQTAEEEKSKSPPLSPKAKPFVPRQVMPKFDEIPLSTKSRTPMSGLVPSARPFVPQTRAPMGGAAVQEILAWDGVSDDSDSEAN